MEIEETSCCEVYLCASCRRNFTRWRQSGINEHKDKYFVKANSQGKPFVNKTTLAQRNRRLANITETSPDSPLLCLPEVLMLDIFTCLGIVDIFNLRLTCQYLSKLCSSNYLWKLLLRRDFPDANHLLDETLLSKSSVAYRFLYSRCHFRRKERRSDIARKWVNLKISFANMKENSWSKALTSDNASTVFNQSL